MSDMHGLMEVSSTQQFREPSQEFVTPTRLSSPAVDTSPPNQESVHFDSAPEGTPQPRLQDSATLIEDPESPRDIVRENVLVLFPVALFFVFFFFALAIAFSD